MAQSKCRPFILENVGFQRQLVELEIIEERLRSSHMSMEGAWREHGGTRACHEQHFPTDGSKERGPRARSIMEQLVVVEACEGSSQRWSGVLSGAKSHRRSYGHCPTHPRQAVGDSVLVALS